MELIRGLHNLRARHQNCVATIGAFDGVHHGHQAVLRQLVAKSRELGLPSTVILFEPLPREFFAPVQSPARLMSFREKFVALKKLGIDRVLRIRFDRPLSLLSAEEFIRIVFVDGLGIKYIVVGDDLRFGHDREGDFNLLRKEGEKFGFDVVDTKTLTIDGARASSTHIRQALAASDFELAEAMLGKPFSISGRVVVGQQLGRQLGVPTANLQLNRLSSPLSGVYAVEVEGVADHLIPGVANVGTRPTIADLTKAILEVHLLDFDRDIYRKNISVIFRHKLRDERRFDSLEALKTQIFNDLDQARDFFGL